MPLIALTRRGGAVEAAGDLHYRRSADPYRGADGTQQYSLEAGWEWRDGTLQLYADRLGMIPIFYRSEAARLFVATSLHEIAAADRGLEADRAALAVFLRLGFFLGDDTPLDRVQVLSPGTRVRLANGELAVPGHNAFIDVPESRLSREETTGRYIDLFRAAVRSRVDGCRIGLPLSGGRDSRHILLELAHLKRPPDFAVTYQEAGLGDIAVARRLSAALGLEHRVTQIVPRDHLDIERTKNRRTHFLTDEHYWFADVAVLLRELGANLFFDGIGGDVLSNGLFFEPALDAALRRKDYDAVAARLLGPRGPLPFLSLEWQRALSWDVARERLVAELARHTDHLNPIKSFFFWNRTRREIALAPLVLGESVQVAMPYLDPDIVDFFMSLPRSYAAAGFHDEVINAAYPEYADIAYATKDQGAAARALLGERLRAAHGGLKLLRRPYASLGFLLPRVPRALLPTRLESTYWWLDRLVYLEGLLALPGVSGAADVGSSAVPPAAA